MILFFKSTFALGLFLISVSVSCNNKENLLQTSSSEKIQGKLGGPCEGCEAIYEFGDRKLNSIDTLPKYGQTEPKLKITGTVYKKDGKTPAKDVILYIYHTNREGIYETLGNETGWAKRHGYIRGWIKTDASGKYSFYTFRPAAYPSLGEPEHIHVTVLEPEKEPYYLDDYLFEDDKLLGEEKRNSVNNRGGNGILMPQKEDEYLVIQRDIILGFNIPNYR